MDPVRRPRIKICCITTVDEARLAVAAGAGAVGLVGPMPGGPGVIPDTLIASIAPAVPPPVATFLLTSERTADGIVAHHRRARTTAVQIVDRPSGDIYAELRERLPGVKLVQVVHVTGPASADEAASLTGKVDALLLDSGRPESAELGGTGRRHDWTISRLIRESSPLPVFLAGGLRPENVREAIETVGPFALDVCSGVRTNGRLDPVKLTAFFTEAGY